VVRFNDRTAKWQARKTTLIPLLFFKLFTAIILWVIEEKAQANFSPLTECLNIGFVALQIYEMSSSENGLSWKAYNATWVIMASFEMLTIVKLTPLPHPLTFVPICLLLAIVRFCLSCAVMQLATQAKIPPCSGDTTRKDDDHWDWQKMVQIYGMQGV
jgi:hypothetical protein